MKRLLVIIVVGAFLLTGCSDLMPLNNAPPSSIDQVMAYKKGNWLVINIILADANGAMTTANGWLYYEITMSRFDSLSKPGFMIGRVYLLYDRGGNISRSSFRRTKVDRGLFEREVTMAPVARISYSVFSQNPSGRTGKIRVTLISEDKRRLKGEETINF